MLNVAYKPLILSVVMLNAVMLSVVMLKEWRRNEGTLVRNSGGRRLASPSQSQERTSMRSFTNVALLPIGFTAFS